MADARAPSYDEAAEIAARIEEMRAAYREFTKAAQAIAKRQRVLLAKAQNLIDQEKIARVRKNVGQ